MSFPLTTDPPKLSANKSELPKTIINADHWVIETDSSNVPNINAPSTSANWPVVPQMATRHKMMIEVNPVDLCGQTDDEYLSASSVDALEISGHDDVDFPTDAEKESVTGEDNGKVKAF